LSSNRLGGFLALSPCTADSDRQRIVTAITCEKQSIFNGLRIDFPRIGMAYCLMSVRAKGEGIALPIGGACSTYARLCPDHIFEYI
jgi:hypothetical protein